MDGFAVYKIATLEELPAAVAVLDPFRVVRLAGNALDQCRRRVQHDLHVHRGRVGDLPYKSRRTLDTRNGPLTTNQYKRITALFAIEAHAGVEAT